MGLNLWDLLSLIYCVGCDAAEIYNTVKTVSTLYERQTCSMCTCTYEQDNTDTLDGFFQKVYPINILLSLSPYSFLQTYHCSVEIIHLAV